MSSEKTSPIRFLAAQLEAVMLAKVKCKTNGYCSGSNQIVTLSLPKGHWDGVAVPGYPAVGRA